MNRGTSKHRILKVDYKSLYRLCLTFFEPFSPVPASLRNLHLHVLSSLRLKTPPLHRHPAPKMLRNIHLPRRPPLQPRAAEPTRPHLLPQPRLRAPRRRAIAAQLLAVERVEAGRPCTQKCGLPAPGARHSSTRARSAACASSGLASLQIEASSAGGSLGR